MKIGYRRIGKYTGTEAIQNSIDISQQGIELALKKDEDIENRISIAEKGIDLSVKKDDVINSINLSQEGAIIDANKISLQGKEINLTSDNINIDSTNFKVDKDGNATCNNLKASNGTFDGIVNASSGTIGGFTLTNNKLYSGNGNERAGIGLYGQEQAFFAGSENSSAAPFRVGHDGSMNASSGTIGGWTLTNDGMTNGSLVINKNGYTTIYTLADLLVMQKIAIGEWSPSQSVIRHYDFNGNGVVDSADILHLSKMLGFYD